MTATEMYQETILEYYRHPKNRGQLEKPDLGATDANTACGDELTIELTVKDDIITDARFNGKGCVISQAACSMLLETITGKKLEDARQIEKQDVLDLLGIPISGIRLKCALLGLKVLKLAIYTTDQEKLYD